MISKSRILHFPRTLWLSRQSVSDEYKKPSSPALLENLLSMGPEILLQKVPETLRLL